MMNHVVNHCVFLDNDRDEINGYKDWIDEKSIYPDVQRIGVPWGKNMIST